MNFTSQTKTVLLYAVFSGHSSLPPVENLKNKCGFPGETSNAIPWVCDLESFLILFFLVVLHRIGFFEQQSIFDE
jgi:hypothetical protein